jgi:hypothetical protein
MKIGCIAVVFALFVWRMAWAEPNAASTNRFPVDRCIRYGFTVQNTTGSLLKTADLWTFAPLPQTSFQVCRSVKTSHQHEVITDRFGNRVLHFAFRDLPPYGVKVVTVEAELGLSDVPEPRWADTNVFLRAESAIEIDSPEFARLAPRFPDGGVSDTAKRVYEWVSGTLQDAGYVKRDRGALAALRERRGDCTEYAYLFVALCRARGIPARAIGGYRCTANRVLDPASYHNWAEYYDAGRWHLADAQRRVLDRDGAQYVAMRVMGESDSPIGGFPRFRHRGEGLQVRMN